ncbi:MAG: hypothetical protein KAQ94_09630 [Arcobacteraceae bacterium]|nr:hypothetical protein [Arcobacteraceae bacterium]
MLKIFIIFILNFTFINAAIKIDTNIQPFKLLDQFDKEHKLTKDTREVIFVFQKSTGHLVKDYLDTVESDFLAKRDALFVMDLSAVPSLLKFIVLHNLIDYKYPILLLDDEDMTKVYLDIEKCDKVMIVKLNNFKITNIEYVTTKQELEKVLN